MEASISLPSKLCDVAMDSPRVSCVSEVNEMNDLSDHTIEEETNLDFSKAHFVTDEVFADDYPQDMHENCDPCNFDAAEVVQNNGGCEVEESPEEPEDGPRTSRRIRYATKRYQGSNDSNPSRKRMRKNNSVEGEDASKRKSSFLPESMDLNLKGFSNPSPNSESSSLSSLTESPLRFNDRPSLTSKGARKFYDFKPTVANGVDAMIKPMLGAPFSEDPNTLLENSHELSCSVRGTDELNRLEDTKAEIQKRLGSFEHIKENVFLCERRLNKESDGMECDCTLSKEDVSRGRRGCGDSCLNRLLFIECGKTCSLGKRCSNKRFQNIENAPIEVFKTLDKGFGLRATKDIPRETFLMEYVGEVLDYRQFQKRARRYALDDVQHFYFMALSSDFFIDASIKGSISRFINHSCDPNAETQKWTVNGELRVGFFSKSFIREGEEITFDYKYERYGQEAQKCFCGARACKGWLGGEPDKENRRPAGIESDEEFSTESDEESGASVSKRQLPGSNTTIKSNNHISKFKKLQRQRPIKTAKTRKTFESREYEDVLNRLKISGIKTRAHTLELTRLMVRVTDLSPKITLASLLREAESPCRRLFLDYHGLRILHGWMACLGSSSAELDLKLEIQDTLAAIPIPNKTMLVESKVWDAVTNWSEISAEQSSESSRTASPEFSSTLQCESSEKKSPSDCPESKVKKEETERQESLNAATDPRDQESKLADNGEKKQKIIQDMFLTVQEEISAPKPKAGCHDKVINVRDKALGLLHRWSVLQEVFKIPRKELVKLRVEHEREVERAAASTSVPVTTQKYPEHYSYDRRSALILSDKIRSSRSGSPSRTRISRLDDCTGLLQNDRLSREDRRVLFEQRAKLQQEEAARRAQLKELHDYKCFLLKVDPAITAMFRGYPPVFYGPEQTPPISPIEIEWDCPKMANLPCEAFREGDDQLVDPRFYSFDYIQTGDIPQFQRPDHQSSFDVGQIPLPGNNVHFMNMHARGLDDHSKLPVIQNIPQPLTNGYSTTIQSAEQDLELETELHNSSRMNVDFDSNPSPSKKSRAEFIVRLPKDWTTARDSLGRVFFFHLKTKERSWKPPFNEEKLHESALAGYSEDSMIELETLSTDSECPGDDAEEDGVESDNEDDEDSDKEETAERIVKEINSGQTVMSDLSAHEKEYLSRSRKKTKEERRMDRKNKKIRDPEKWEEEQLKRKERYVKHLQDGLVQEWIIPRMTDRDKLSLMSLKEQRDRLANQKAIREQQNLEELEEIERDRIEQEKGLKRERDELRRKKAESEAEKIKCRFIKDASKIVVQHLNPYRRDDAQVAKIASTKDFKHLAKKLTNRILHDELRFCNRIQQLKFTESMHKKSKEFVRRYMSKYGQHYLPSPDH